MEMKPAQTPLAIPMVGSPIAAEAILFASPINYACLWNSLMGFRVEAVPTEVSAVYARHIVVSLQNNRALGQILLLSLN
jgi:hypothetical protein